MTVAQETPGTVLLVDRSDRGKLALAGDEAKAALNGLVSNDIESLETGTGLYAAVLTPKGKMLGDLRVLDAGDELLLDMERTALQAIFDVLRHGLIGYRAEIDKRTLQCGLLSLIGPDAAARAGAADLPAAEHAHRAKLIGGARARMIRTDTGVDVLCAIEGVETVSAALVDAGATPAPPEAAEIARVESGRPRYGVDLDDSVIPQEAGINERAVSFTKGCYVGQETVARLHYRGKPNRHLRGLRLSAPAAPGTPLALSGRQVGTLTSSIESPRLGPVGLAILRREAEPGALLAAGDGGITAEVVELPF